MPRGTARCKRGDRSQIRSFDCTDLAGPVFHFLTQSHKIMKRWAILTVLLYAMALLLLTVPVLWIAFGGWAKSGVMGLQDALKVYLNWGYWLWLGVLVAGQVLLLLLPINISERRLPARRPLQTPILVTAFFLASLFLAGIVSILCAVFKEDGFFPFAFVSGNTDNPAGSDFTVGGIVTLLVFWLMWAFIFRRCAGSDEPETQLKRGTRWLLRGSILELLVAVPSHVIVRRRDDCCAPIGTFWGIATGISVMLLCFGPGVFFLFMERFERLQPKSPDQNRQE